MWHASRKCQKRTLDGRKKHYGTSRISKKSQLENEKQERLTLQSDLLGGKSIHSQTELNIGHIILLSTPDLAPWLYNLPYLRPVSKTVVQAPSGNKGSQ